MKAKKVYAYLRKKWNRSVIRRKETLPAKKAPRARETSGVGVYLYRQIISYAISECKGFSKSALGNGREREVIELLHVPLEAHEVKVRRNKDDGLRRADGGLEQHRQRLEPRARQRVQASPVSRAEESTYLGRKVLESRIVLSIHVRSLEPREDLLDPARHAREHTLVMRFSFDFASDVDEGVVVQRAHLGRLVRREKDRLSEGSGSASAGQVRVPSSLAEKK